MTIAVRTLLAILLVASIPRGGTVWADDTTAAAGTVDNETPWMTPPATAQHTPWGLLHIDRAQGSSSRRWTTPQSLTGNWGGLRDRLEEEYGISLLGSYTAEVAGNPVGGSDQGIRYTHDIGIALLVDLGRLIALEDTFLLVSADERAGSSNSARDIGNVFAVQQLFGGETTRLVQLALGRQLLDDRLDLVVGRIHALDDFISSPLYCNAQNVALCGNPLSIPNDISISSYPNAAWGARARWAPHEGVYLMGGVYNAFKNFRANKYHGVDFSIRHDSGAIGIGELGLMPDRLPWTEALVPLPGHFKVGGYYDTEPLREFRTGEQTRGTSGIYVGIDQMVYREAADPAQGLVPFVAFHHAPPDVNQQEWFVDWGLVYEGLVPGRDRDIAGLFGAWGRFSTALEASQEAAGQPGQTYELVLELNYRWNALPWLYLQPDIQGVINPGGTGEIPNALVLALQFGVPL